MSASPSISLDRPQSGPAIGQLAVAVSAIALEGYDLLIYILFAGPISRAMFPAGAENVAFLLTVASIGIGYVARPLGGILLGAYADWAGRSKAIVLTVLLLSLSTGVIGLIPTFASIGVAAPALVVVARLVQGFAAGGSSGGSISYLAESAPAGRRGLYASWQQASQLGSFLFASGVATLIANLLPADSGVAWRLPFLLALLFGPLALLVRFVVRDPALYARARAATGAPLARQVTSSLPSIVIGFGVTCLWTITAFVLLFFMPGFASRSFGIPLPTALLSATIAGAVAFVLCPVAGWVSDRVGRKATMLAAATVLFVVIYPLFAHLRDARSFGALLLAQLVFAVCIAFYTGPVCAFMAELFPTRIRSTTLSIAYNIAVLAVGAFGPWIIAEISAATGNPLSMAFYVMVGAAVSVIALLCARDRTFSELAE